MGMIQQVGSRGVYLDNGNFFSFEINGVNVSSHQEEQPDRVNSISRGILLGFEGFSIYSRGLDNLAVERQEKDIKANRLLPGLIRKQCAFLYGKGPRVYIQRGSDESTREWVDEPIIYNWLESWQDNGMEFDYKHFAKSIIKNFYFFRDFFVRWRFSLDSTVAGVPRVAGLEALDNSSCRLATPLRPMPGIKLEYSDFDSVAYGDFTFGAMNAMKQYPLWRISDVGTYREAAVSHHREPAPGEFYGMNEMYEGIARHLQISNDIPEYIDSFLNNSLAAKVHVIIPDAWVSAKREMIARLCEENEQRQSEGKDLFTLDGIELGTTFSESYVVQYVQNELRKVASYLSGKNNQGKAYASTSFMDGAQEQRWRIESVDLRYKEYLEGLTSVDKRVDEVLLSSTGMDSSITAVAKPGMISKSGSDTLYNYILYVLTLTGDDEICSEPFNRAIKINFPELYRQGYRIGYYRQLPEKQEETTPEDRIQNQIE